MEQKKQNIYGVIMAGGSGTRFWPLSTSKEPKQLLNLSGKDLMINETIERLVKCIKKEHLFIVTNAAQVQQMKEAVKGRVLENHILCEPCARNTSACIGYAAMEIVKKYGDGILCICPADHFIKDTKAFSKVLKKAIWTAENEDKLVTIGISPTYPAVGYGYIKFDAAEETDAKKVLEFKEKPKAEIAKKYFESGTYAWNSGIFIWKASTILKKIQNLLPEVYICIEKIGDAMQTEQEEERKAQIYPNIPSISIDYGILEKSDDILVVLGEFGWSDVGSWENLDAIYEKDENGNILIGNQIHIDTKNCISYAKKRRIAAIGVENLIIVETEDAILVCDKKQAQKVKLVAEKLKESE